MPLGVLALTLQPKDQVRRRGFRGEARALRTDVEESYASGEGTVAHHESAADVFVVERRPTHLTQMGAWTRTGCVDPLATVNPSGH